MPTSQAQSPYIKAAAAIERHVEAVGAVFSKYDLSDRDQSKLQRFAIDTLADLLDDLTPEEPKQEPSLYLTGS
jgi:hypothetical protein